MTEPEMQYVDSSNVEAIGYDPEGREIYVRFLNGGTYAYGEATEALYAEFVAAPSIGSFVNRVLKTGHPYRRV
jgi:hypothetical protein